MSWNENAIMQEKEVGGFMRVNPIFTGLSFRRNDEIKRKPINKYQMVPLTGYVAVGGGLAAGISGLKHNRTVHKFAAMVALAATAAHIFLLKTMYGMGKNQHKRA